MKQADASDSAVDQLARRLEDPATQQSLNTVLDRLDVIALSVDAVDGFLRRSDTIGESLVDSLQDVKKTLDQPGFQETVKRVPRGLENLPALLDTLDRSRQILESPGLARILELLSDPDRLAALAGLLEKLETVAFFLDALDGFLRRSDTVIDSVAKGYKDLKEALPPGYLHIGELVTALYELLPTIQQILPKIRILLESKSFQSLMNSGVLDPKTVSVVGRAGDALVDSFEKVGPTSPNIGVMGVMSATRDPDVMRAFTFLTEFGRRFGQQLKKPHA